jgi:hypothetical protein
MVPLLAVPPIFCGVSVNVTVWPVLNVDPFADFRMIKSVAVADTVIAALAQSLPTGAQPVFVCPPFATTVLFVSNPRVDPTSAVNAMGVVAAVGVPLDPAPIT